MAKHSAGLLMYRLKGKKCEILLVHPGGPFWAKKDLQSWSIPKGGFEADENPLEAAKREFKEETGLDVSGDFLPLESLKQPSGKILHTWAVEGDCDPSHFKSNVFSMEWPPKSGKQQDFPEIDKAEWFGIETAREKIHRGQAELIDRLLNKLDLKRNMDTNEADKNLKDAQKPYQQSLFE